MPNYLLQKTSDGNPIGVFTDQSDYFDPQYEDLRPEGRQLVYSKLPTVEWSDFIERLADTKPSRTMSWDVYYDASPNLQDVLTHARRDVENTGDAVSE